jgi:hypothetical protein
LPEDLLLELQVFEDGLDHDVGFMYGIPEHGMDDDVVAGGVGLFPGDDSEVREHAEIVINALFRGQESCGVQVMKADVVPREGEFLGDAVSHQARADDAYFFYVFNFQGVAPFACAPRHFECLIPVGK